MKDEPIIGHETDAAEGAEGTAMEISRGTDTLNSEQATDHEQPPRGGLWGQCGHSWTETTTPTEAKGVEAPVSHEAPSAPNTPEAMLHRGLGVSQLCRDPNKQREDIALIGRAIRNRWPMSAKTRRVLVNRLVAVTEKEAVLVPFGPDNVLMPMDGPADDKAIAAARVLVAMMGQNQADRHHADDLAKPDASVNVNVGVPSTRPVTLYQPGDGRRLIDLPADEQRRRLAAILDRIRTGHTAVDAAGGETVAMREATPVEVARYALEHEPGYIDYLRQKAMNEDERANGLEESQTCRFAAGVIGSDSTRNPEGG